MENSKLKTNNQFSLNVATRLMILMNLPEQGSVTEMISKRNVRKKIDFSSEEVEKLKIETKDNRIVWEPETESFTIEFNDSEVEFLRTIVNKISDSGAITDSVLEFAEALQ